MITGPLASVAVAMPVAYGSLSCNVVTVTFDGVVITGAVVSITVTVAVQELLLPLWSAAQMVTKCAPRPTDVPAAGIWLMVGVSQLSLASTSPVKFGINACAVTSALIVSLVAQVAMTGACVSMTVTVKVFVAVLPLVSVAMVVTVVVPLLKVEPLGGVETTLNTPQLSMAVTVHVTSLLLHSPRSAGSTMLPGTKLNVGG